MSIIYAFTGLTAVGKSAMAELISKKYALPKLSLSLPIEISQKKGYLNATDYFLKDKNGFYDDYYSNIDEKIKIAKQNQGAVLENIYDVLTLKKFQQEFGKERVCLIEIDSNDKDRLIRYEKRQLIEKYPGSLKDHDFLRIQLGIFDLLNYRNIYVNNYFDLKTLERNLLYKLEAFNKKIPGYEIDIV